MKKILFLTAAAFIATCCQQTTGYPYQGEGMPTLSKVEAPETAHFGDSITISATIIDENVPLSTLQTKLFYGPVEVSNATVRTTENGEWTAKLYVPIMAKTPSGDASLQIISTNIGNVTDTVTKSVAISYANYSEIALVLEDGTEYPMTQKDGSTTYTVTDTFPKKFNAKVTAQPADEAGNEISWGLTSGEVAPLGSDYIVFSNAFEGEYEVAVDLEACTFSPFIDMRFGGESLKMVSPDVYQVELNVNQGDNITTKDIAELSELFIDEDYLVAAEDNSFDFLPVSGAYRFIINFANSSITVKRLQSVGGETAVLSETGEGAVWILGYNIGKPSCDYQPGWTPGNGYCMAEISPRVFQVTVTAGVKIEGATPNGVTLQNDWLDFKFFGQDGWGTEFNADNAEYNFDEEPLMCTEGGNIKLVDAETGKLPEGNRYRFVIDLSDNYPVNLAKIRVEKL